MNYFVSIENSLYYHWQIELLIESFKIHGLEKNLYVYVASGEYKEEIPKDCRNLINHKNLFKHENFGRKATELMALYKYVNENNGEYPFVFIHPCMLLKNPIDKYNKEYDIVLNSYYEPNSRIDDFLLSKNINIKFDFSTPIIFNNNKIGKDFFEELLINAKYIQDQTDLDFPCDELAWKFSMTQNYEKFNMGYNLLSCTLLHNDVDVPFIDYNHGVPREFNKRFFVYSNPYEVLLNMNVSNSCDYLHKILNSYLN